VSSVRRRAVAALTALACAGAGHAIASDDPAPPPTAFKLPGMTLRVEPSQVTVGVGEEVTFSAVLTRKLPEGRLELTLPRSWLTRSANGNARAVVPLTGSAPRGRVVVRRSGRLVRFAFTKGRRGDIGRYTVADRALRAGTYRARFALRVDGHVEASGTASIVVLALPVEVPAP